MLRGYGVQNCFGLAGTAETADFYHKQCRRAGKVTMSSLFQGQNNVAILRLESSSTGAIDGDSIYLTALSTETTKELSLRL